MARLPLVKMYFKSQVAFKEFTPPVLFAMQEVAQVMVANGSPFTVTSGDDRVHRTGSDHGLNDAFDVRTRLLATAVLDRVADQISTRIGPTFVVINEGDHFHVAYRPKPAIRHDFTIL